MEMAGSGGGIRYDLVNWWWMGSAAQLGWGIRAIRRGYAGDSRLMPFKAFAVASLFVGAAAAATIGTLKASGINTGQLRRRITVHRRIINFANPTKVEDAKEVGENIRTTLGVPPRNNTG